jgi:hypothetical protein
VSLQEFDQIRESEISIINRLAAEREDNVMWREFRTRLLRNMGLVRVTLSCSSMQLSWDGVLKPTSTTVMTLNCMQHWLGKWHCCIEQYAKVVCFIKSTIFITYYVGHLVQ